MLRLRQHYPDADIICTLGSMDVVQKGSEWPGYMRTAVEELKDPKIFTYCFAYKNTPGHPKTAEQRQMAEELIAFIKTHIGWQ